MVIDKWVLNQFRLGGDLKYFRRMIKDLYNKMFISDIRYLWNVPEYIHDDQVCKYIINSYIKWKSVNGSKM